MAKQEGRESTRKHETKRAKPDQGSSAGKGQARPAVKKAAVKKSAEKIPAEKQPAEKKPEKTVQRRSAQPARKQSSTELPRYPNAQLVPTEKGPMNIEITEMISPDEWQTVLSFYQQELTAAGWELFASHYLTERGTLSFRRSGETITVLAEEQEDTHIRIYLQK